MRKFLTIAVLLLAFGSQAFAQKYTFDNPRWRPQDTIDDWNRLADMVYGHMDFDCVQTLAADTSLVTEVDADSASGQATLNVTSETGFAANDYVVINQGGAREEVCQISTTGATTLTMSECCIESNTTPFFTCNGANLNYTHTAAQADDVELTNRIGPLVPFRLYELSLSDGAAVGIAGHYMSGKVAVTSDPSNASLASPTPSWPIYAGEKRYVRPSQAGIYLSVTPVASASAFKACPLGY